MQRYFASLNNNKIVLSTDDVHHLLNVMRMKVNEHIEVVINGVSYLCNIDSINPLNISIISKIDRNSELNIDVNLILCLPKGDKIDLIIQKAVELGANKIIFVHSKRSINKMTNDDLNRKMVRYNKIIKEASEQCNRNSLMKIEGIYQIKELDNITKDCLNLVAYEGLCGKTGQISNLLKNNNKPINIIIGPEGGFEEDEISLLDNLGFHQVSLGKRILRLETAVFYSLSVIGYILENYEKEII
ncbi:MAG: RsmE family RNA methyltransferase [Bacilli bacterium]